MPLTVNQNQNPPVQAANRQAGFSLVEVAIALALIATVLLGMLALLASGVNSRTETRRDTLAVQISHQVHQSLRGFRAGFDDVHPVPTSNNPGLLDEFTPFDFHAFPAGGSPGFIIGFDKQGRKQGKNLAADYLDGTGQQGVDFFATLEGKSAASRPGLTEVTIGIEHPASVPQRHRHRREFHVFMVPHTAATVQPGGGSP